MSDPNQESNEPVYIPSEPIEPVFPSDRIEKGEKPCSPNANTYPLNDD